MSEEDRSRTAHNSTIVVGDRMGMWYKIEAGGNAFLAHDCIPCFILFHFLPQVGHHALLPVNVLRRAYSWCFDADKTGVICFIVGIFVFFSFVRKSWGIYSSFKYSVERGR